MKEQAESPERFDVAWATWGEADMTSSFFQSLRGCFCLGYLDLYVCEPLISIGSALPVSAAGLPCLAGNLLICGSSRGGGSEWEVDLQEPWNILGTRKWMSNFIWKGIHKVIQSKMRAILWGKPKDIFKHKRTVKCTLMLVAIWNSRPKSNLYFCPIIQRLLKKHGLAFSSPLLSQTHTVDLLSAHHWTNTLIGKIANK